MGFTQAHPNYSPARASQLVAYRRIITPANNCYPLAAWLNYDVQFLNPGCTRPLPYAEMSVIQTFGYNVYINPFTSNPLTLSTLQSNKPLSCKLSFSSLCHTNIFKWTIPLPPFLQPPVGSKPSSNYRPFACHMLTVQPATVKTTHSLTTVYSVVPSTAPVKGSLAQ